MKRRSDNEFRYHLDWYLPSSITLSILQSYKKKHPAYQRDAKPKLNMKNLVKKVYLLLGKNEV